MQQGLRLAQNYQHNYAHSKDRIKEFKEQTIKDIRDLNPLKIKGLIIWLRIKEY